MNCIKGFALVTCLVTPLAFVVATGASADPAPAAAPAAPATTGGAMSKPAMTDGAKTAKAADCSKQADAKKLHGEARRKIPLGLQESVIIPDARDQSRRRTPSAAFSLPTTSGPFAEPRLCRAHWSSPA